MLVRANAPVAGASDRPLQSRRSWQIDLSARTLTSDNHYVGTVLQTQRQTLGTYVINKQNVLDLGVTYAFTERLSASLSLPFVQASWSVPLPQRPTLGPRSEQSASGLGDTVLTGRSWLLDPSRHGTANLSLGLGLKVPTGNSAAKGVYPDFSGQNPALKAVDQSIQPGDGGWGVTFELQGFAKLGRVTAFGGGTYLANPKDTNATPSLVSGFGLAKNPALANLLVNSVPDQFVARAGFVVPVPVSGLTASVAWRLEGQPRYDLFGRSDGFRRPGMEMFVEPGVNYSRGRSTWSVSVPLGFYRNRFPNPYTGSAGDATFPTAIVLARWSARLGK